MRDRRAGRLVAAEHEQTKEARKLRLAEPFAVHFGLNEPTREIVARAGAPLGAQFARIFGEAMRGRGAERQQAQVGRVAVSRLVERRTRRRAGDQLIGELDQIGVIVLGRAENVGDQGDRDRFRNDLDPIAAAVGLEPVELGADAPRNDRGMPGEGARREEGRDEPPETRMFGRVHVDHRRAQRQRVVVDVVDVDMAERRTERLEIARGGGDVVEPADGPEAVTRIAADRVPGEPRRAPEFGEGRLRNARREDRGVGEIDREYGPGRHRSRGARQMETSGRGGGRTLAVAFAVTRQGLPPRCRDRGRSGSTPWASASG